MEKSDATQVAVGSAFLGVGGVGMTILLPLAAAVKGHPWTAPWFLIPCSVAGSLGVTGFYMLAAVYTGWPLPATASERLRTPRLAVHNLHVVSIDAQDNVVSAFDVFNKGVADAENATVNVLVPNSVTGLRSSDNNGNRIHAGESGPSAESLLGDATPSNLWVEGPQRFPGRAYMSCFYRAHLPEPHDFPLRLKILSSSLSKPFYLDTVVPIDQYRTKQQHDSQTSGVDSGPEIDARRQVAGD